MIDEQKDVATAVCWRYSLTRRHVASGFCMRQAIYVAQYHTESAEFSATF